MTNIAWLFFGVLILTLTAFYMVWTKFRVLIVRQQLFDVRDELWNRARDLNGFDDPAYKAARDRLNTLIRIAHKISLPVLAYASRIRPNENEFGTSTNPELQVAIDASVDKAVNVIMHYVFLYRPFSGIVPAIGLVAFVTTLRSVASIHDRISNWFKGDGPTRLEAVACSG